MTVEAQPLSGAGFDAVQDFATKDGTRLTFRAVGPASGRPALLIHGHTQTSVMWRVLAKDLAARGFHVICPDLRVQLAASNDDPVSKARLAGYFGELVRNMGPRDHVVIGHDLGAMIAYAYAAQYRAQVRAAVVMEATPPGIGFWDQLLTDPRTWHFGFYGTFAEQLVAGRAELYLERFWAEFSGTGQSAISEPERTIYIDALRAAGGVRQAFGHFEAFATDIADNARFAQTPLPMPVLAIGGAASFGPVIGQQMALVASDVTSAVIPDAGHWLLEENGPDTIRTVIDFLTPFLGPVPHDSGQAASGDP